ncbi:DUF1284 domain-containing protein [Clostridium sp. JS66]|uniref:DUF1284 domain-containing protein n=1 Tax=Clostridium sp. JS66 TaxID=3064705 RepID=UPI00298DA0DD|nr:DUF1284 domain-containing protein [Clostridium sp. JS66]WPC43490.1 DUF1284 domain-containing protein [Clostridium sp. JS66]
MLVLRAHHLLCIQGYEGNGYSFEFTKNMDRVVNNLSDNMYVKIVMMVDDICVKCPHKLKDDTCKSQEKVFELDFKVLNELNLIVNRTYLYKDILNSIRENLSYEKFQEICGSCQWFSYGYCKNRMFGNP